MVNGEKSNHKLAAVLQSATKINDNDASTPSALQPYTLFNSVTSELTCKHTMSELGFG